MKIKTLFVCVLFVFLVSACGDSAGKMDMKVELPVGVAYADGQEILFMHTEASDPEIAGLLTTMMNSPVLTVGALKDTPDSALANVYVFDNGLKGNGPLGFQADVFDSPPGTPGYSPLRRLNIVSWVDPAAAREFKAVAEILAAETAGEVTIRQPGVVINMPFVAWQGGNR